MPRCKTESMLLKFPKHCGAEPLKLLLERSRTRRDFNLQIEEGTSHVNLLLDARIRNRKFSYLKIELGIGPCNELLLKSRTCNIELCWNSPILPMN